MHLMYFNVFRDFKQREKNVVLVSVFHQPVILLQQNINFPLLYFLAIRLDRSEVLYIHMSQEMIICHFTTNKYRHMLT